MTALSTLARRLPAGNPPQESFRFPSEKTRPTSALENASTSTNPLTYYALSSTAAESGTLGKGRFLSPDKVEGRLFEPQSWNRYAYAGNNPLKYVDPTGLEKIWTQSVMSALASAGAAVSSAGTTLRELPLGLGQGPGAGLEYLGTVVAGSGELFNQLSSGPGAVAAGDDIGTVVNAFATDAIRAAGVAMFAFGAAEARSGAGVPKGSEVFRVSGGASRELGHSWTTVDPTKVANYRDAAGLPNSNAATTVTKGTLVDGKGVIVRRALPLDGNRGGLPEVVVPNPGKQIVIVTTTKLQKPL